MEKMPAILLVVALVKALNGIPLSLCGKIVVELSSLPVTVAQFDKRLAKRA